MLNILVTDFENSGDDVMIFTNSYTLDEVENTLKNKGAQFNEIFEVKDDELQYYIYEPCHLEKK